MKKIMTIILAIMLTITMTPVSAFADIEIADGGGSSLGSFANAAGNTANGDVLYFGSYPQSSTTKTNGDVTPTPANTTADNRKDYIDVSDSSKKYRLTYVMPVTRKGFFLWEPLKWRVMSTTPGSLFVISDKVIEVNSSATASANTWSTSTAHTWDVSTARSFLNGNFINGTGVSGGAYEMGALSSQEGSLLKTISTTAANSTVTISDPQNQEGGFIGTNYGVSTNDKVVILSNHDVFDTANGGAFTDYFSSTTSRAAGATDYAKSQASGGSVTTDTNVNWWLRSVRNNNNAQLVAGDSVGLGTLIDLAKTTANAGLRPAMKIDLSNVKMVTPATGATSKPNTASTTLQAKTAVTSAKTTGMKLTINDASLNGLTAENAAINGQTISFDYAGAATGARKFLSAALTDKSGNILYYGAIKSLANAGDASGAAQSMILPAGVTYSSASHNVTLFVEELNGDKKTDYAGPSISIVPVASAVSYTVTNTQTGLTNLTLASTAATYAENSDPGLVLNAATGYNRPVGVTETDFKIDVAPSTTLTAVTDYTYDNSTGKITMTAAGKVKLTGDISVSATKALAGVEKTYKATVNVNKNGTGAVGRNVKLYQAGSPDTLKYTLNDLGAGVYENDALNGTYKIYEGGADTGKTLIINNAANSTTINLYDLTLVAGTGITSVGSTPVEYQQGAAVSLAAPTITNGYTWSQWTSSNTGLLANQSSQSPTFNMPAGAITLTATAAAASNTITITGSNITRTPTTYNTGSLASVTITPATGYNLPILANVSMTVGGSNYTKWTYNSGTGVISFSEQASLNGNIVITASGVVKTNTITLSSNGSAYASPTVTYGQTYYTAATWPSDATMATARTGYTFGGWWTGTNGTGTQVTSASVVADPPVALTLYAKWTAQTRQLTWTVPNATVQAKVNAGSYATQASPMTVNYDDTVLLKVIPNPGYKIGGTTWTGAGTTGSVDGTDVTGATLKFANITVAEASLAAQVSGVSYSIAYNANSGSGSMTSKTGLVYPNSVTLDANTFTRAAYSFNNWNTVAGGGGQSIANNAAITTLTTPPTDGGTINLYAQWTSVGSSNLTFNSNSGAGTMTAQSFTNGVNQNITTNTFTRTGYSFSGWNTIAGGSGTAYTDGQSISISSATTVYAQWSPITYSISYNTNFVTGGTGAPSAATATKTYGTNLTLATLGTMAKTGYTFSGWNTLANGTGPNYSGGATLSTDQSTTQGATVTLYAKWTPDPYNITWTAGKYTILAWKNGTSAGTVTSPYVGNQDEDIKLQVVATTGYKNPRWTGAAGGTLSQTVNLNDTVEFVDISAAKSVTPATDPYSYDVVFDKNDGAATGVMPNQTVTYDQVFTLNANLYLKTGYKFDGWALTSGGVVAHINGKTGLSNLITPTGDGQTVTLYAKWSVDTTTYNVSTSSSPAAGGSTAGGGATIGIGTSVNLTATANSGYTFTKWTEASQPDVLTSAYPTFTASANRTLTAVFTPNTFTIKFDANLGTGTMSDMNMTYGVNQALTSNSFTPPSGKSFSNWNTQAGGGGTSYSNNYATTGSLTTTNAGTVTLYAQWSANPQTVSWTATNSTVNAKVNGGALQSGVTSPKTVSNGDTLSLIAVSNSGYKNPTWSGTAGGATLTTTTTSNDTLSIPSIGADLSGYVASATPISYKVIFDANLGEGTMLDQNFNYGTAQNLTSNSFTRAGYSFAGWNTNPGGTGTNYANLASVNNLSTTDGGTFTVYAKWTVDGTKYTINAGASPATGGTVSGGGANKAINSAIDLSATPNAGYYFEKWNDGTSDYSVSNNYPQFLATAATAAKTYTAYFKGYPFSIHFDMNGGTGTQIADQTVTFGQTGTPLTLNNNAYTRTGYTFMGWTNSPSGTTVTRNDGGEASNIMTPTGNGQSITLYAKWAPIARNLNIVGANVNISSTKNGSAGTLAIGNNVVAHDDAIVLILTPQTGYKNAHWQTGGNGVITTTTNTNDTLTYTCTADITVTAIVSGIDYKVKYNPYDAFGGPPASGIMADQDLVYGTSTSLTTNAFSKVGYTFNGWSTTPGGAQAYADKAAVSSVVGANTDGSSITLYARWLAGTNYSITKTSTPGFGGSINFIQGTSPAPVSTAIEIQAVANQGYDFGTWSANDTGATPSTTTVANDTLAFILSKNSAVTATFVAKTYSLHFDTQGGSAAAPDATVKYDALYNSAISWPVAPTKPGYSFAGWNTNLGGTGTAVSGAGTEVVKILSNATLFAQWVANTNNDQIFSLTHLDNTGNAKVTTDAVSSATIWGKTGYDRPQTIEIKHVPGKATPIATEYDGASALIEGTDYSYTPADGKISIFANKIKGGVRIKADGVAKDISFDFNLNYPLSPVAPASVVVTFDSKYNIPKTGSWPGAPSRVGYSFTGWNTSSVGGGTAVPSDGNATVGIAANATLYAQWTPLTKTVTTQVDRGGGSYNGGTLCSITVGSQDAAAGINVDFDANKTIHATAGTGYTFNGWEVRNAGTEITGAELTDLGLVNPGNISDWTLKMPYKDLVIIAKFKINKYTITANVANHGKVSATVTGAETLASGAGGSFTADHGEAVVITATPDSGYLFSSWTLDNTGGVGTNTRSFTATKTAAATANFAANSGNLVEKINLTNLDASVANNPFPTGTDPGITLISNPGYNLPEASNLTIQVGNPATLTLANPGDYGYDSSTGLIIFTALGKTKLTDNILITTSGAAKTDNSVIFTTLTHLTVNPATGNYTTNSSPGSFTLTPEGGLTNGYNLPASITVKVGATVLSGATDYSYNNANGQISFTAPYSKLTGDIIIDAIGTADKYNVTFSGNGGNIGAQPTSIIQQTFGSNYSLPTVPVRSGYTFNSWNTEINGMGLTIDGMTSVYKASSNYNTVYAKWDLQSNVVSISTPQTGAGTFSATVGGTPVAITGGVFNAQSGEEVEIMATPAQGYSFTRWQAPLPAGSSTSGASGNILKFTISKNENMSGIFTALNYNIAYDANGGNGTISPLAMTYGVAKNLTASGGHIVRAGYSFAGWNTQQGGGGTAFSDGASVNLIPNNDGETITLFAQWTRQQYTVSLNGTVVNGGFTIAINGGTKVPFDLAAPRTVDSGDTVVLEAAGTSGFAFDKFTGFSGGIAFENTYTWTNMSSNVSGNANFVKTVKVEAGVSPDGTARIRGVYAGKIQETESGDHADKLFNVGSQVVMEATPNKGYGLIGWQENGVDIPGSAVSPFYYTLKSSNCVFVPVFQSAGYKVSMTIPNMMSVGALGTVVVKVNDIEVDTSENKFSCAAGDSVEVTAVPEPGFRFDGWSGDMGERTTNPLTFSATKNIKLSSSFLKNGGAVYTINTKSVPANAGTLVGMPYKGRFNSGQFFDIIAKPVNSGWVFDYWENQDKTMRVFSSMLNPYPAWRNETWTAYYKAKDPSEQCTINTTTNNKAWGKVEMYDEFDEPIESGTPLDIGTDVRLIAKAAAGAYSFMYWTDNNEPIMADIEKGEASNDYGEMISPVYSFKATKDRNISAQFKPADKWLITSYPSFGGGAEIMHTLKDDVISTSLPYDKNDVVQLTANIQPGYTFDGWIERGVKLQNGTANQGGENISILYDADLNESRIQFRATKDRTIKLAVKKLPWSITASVKPASPGGTVSPLSQTINQGDIATVVMVPNQGKKFSTATIYNGQSTTPVAVLTSSDLGKTTVDGYSLSLVNSSDPNGSVRVTFPTVNNTRVEAGFENSSSLVSWDILAAVSGGSGGTVSPGTVQTVFDKGTISLAATPASGKRFLKCEIREGSTVIGSGDLKQTLTRTELGGTTGKYTVALANNAYPDGNVNIVLTGVTENCNVTVFYEDIPVTYVTLIKLSKTSASVSRGKTLTLKATISPSTATNKAVTWTSSNKSYATVSSTGKITVNKKAKKKGKVTITCTAKDGSKKYAKCIITIK
ncbi:MAG: InlB B-repeat-containing protein [Anaerovoracaceae bacterium]